MSQNTFIKMIITALCLAGLATLYFVLISPSAPQSTIELTEETQVIDNPSYPLFEEEPSAELGTSSTTSIIKHQTTATLESLTLLAVVVSNNQEQSSAVIASQDITNTYYVGDSVADSEAVLKAVFANYVLLQIDDHQYSLHLVGGEAASTQSLAIETKPSPSKDNFLSLTAKEIGNRPKVLEHIVSMSTEDNNYAVSPGLNPALIRAAKFKPGDELQTVNGKDVSDPDELAEINELIGNAHTLEFEVLRGGQIITLYLDIPNENLSISKD